MPLLTDCRVLDLGIITAGAATGALLADMGADVIKVESPTYRDPFRVLGSDTEDQVPPLFRATNRNKRAISIDLKRQDGKDIFLRLVRNCDVVIENFRRGVLKDLGIAFDVLRSANPHIILASISSQGETGPDANQISYGSTLEALSGLAWATGYEDGAPTISGRDVNYPDQIVAMFATGAIASALRAVRDGSNAIHLELSQRDLAAFMIGDRFAAMSTGHTVRRLGNAEPPYALQDCFLAADGQWLAVTVEAGDVARLMAALGPDAGQPLREKLKAKTAESPAAAMVSFLRDQGISAAPVETGRGILTGHGTSWSHAMLDFAGSTVKGFPLQVEEDPLSIRRPAPVIGQDTAQILKQIGGYSATEIDRFFADGTIEGPRANPL